MTNSEVVMRPIVSLLYNQEGKQISTDYDWGWYGKENEFSKVGEVDNERI